MVYHQNMSREDPQMKIRLPADLKDQIEAASKQSGRSMNAEIVARLEQSFKQGEEEFDHAFRSAVLEDELKSLEARLGKKITNPPTADEIADQVLAKLSDRVTRSNLSIAHEEAYAYLQLLALTRDEGNLEESIDAETVAAIDKWIAHRKSSISGRSSYGPQGSPNTKPRKK